MSLQTVVVLVLVGLASGLLSGFVGVGGGVIIVPSLLYFLSMSQHQAQGTSLFILLLPVGAFAVFNYWKEGHINWNYGIIIAATFVIGGYIGSKWSLKLSPGLLRLVFGVIMVLISFKLITSGYTAWTNERA